MKRKRRSSKSLSASPRHPFPRLSHPTYWRLIPPAALLLSLAGLAPYARAERLVSIARTSDAAGNSDQRKKSAHENDFLLFGTVFTEPGFALPGAAIRVRRADKKKARWEARSDRRGEFAVRVPVGAEYEMTVTATGYQRETRKIDAKTGNRADLVFRLSPAPGGKPK